MFFEEAMNARRGLRLHETLDDGQSMRMASDKEPDLVHQEGAENGRNRCLPEGEQLAVGKDAAEEHRGLTLQARTDKDRQRAVLRDEMLDLHDGPLSDGGELLTAGDGAGRAGRNDCRP